MSSGNAERVQGAGPLTGAGDPIDTNIVGVGPGAIFNVSVIGPLGPVTIIDGGDVCEGATTDGPVGTVNSMNDNDGTSSAKLRSILRQMTGSQIDALYSNGDDGQLVIASLMARRMSSDDPQRVGCDRPDQAEQQGVSGAGLALYTNAVQMLQRYDATINAQYLQIARTPCVFKSVSTAANGNTALWTPAAGNKFRLMRYCVHVTGNAAAAAAAVKTISLLDGAAGVTGQVHSVFVPGAALAAGELYSSGWIDLGNGYLSTAANNVLNVNLSTALTAGVVRVIACGTEE